MDSTVTRQLPGLFLLFGFQFSLAYIQCDVLEEPIVESGKELAPNKVVSKASNLKKTRFSDCVRGGPLRGFSYWVEWTFRLGFIFWFAPILLFQIVVGWFVVATVVIVVDWSYAYGLVNSPLGFSLLPWISEERHWLQFLAYSVYFQLFSVGAVPSTSDNSPGYSSPRQFRWIFENSRFIDFFLVSRRVSVIFYLLEFETITIAIA